MYESTTNFWRDSSRHSPHNAVTSMDKLLDVISKKGYRMTSSKKNLLNYVAKEVNIEDNESTEDNEISKSKQANTVTIPYSPNNTVKYEYDTEKKEYIRYTRNKQQTDWNTQNIITTKNIIITKCKNTTLDDNSGKGRQTLDNIKNLDGYYITNGKAIPIKCEKPSRKDKTIYKSLDGKEIEINDGKTFIQICPEESVITFE